MQKGYKRGGKGMAVLYCFIGLFFLIVVILIVYFILTLDYSDKLDADTTVRPYLEANATPEPTATLAAAIATQSAQSTASIKATTSPEATASPSSTPTVTATPTQQPTSTPEATAIPESEVSAMKFSGYQLPELSEKNVQLGITKSSRSHADNYQYLTLEGYAYIDESDYDGSEAELYLVIIRSTGNTALALPVKAEGISGVDHEESKCQNASASDFKAVLDVSQFPDDSYTLGMVFRYHAADGSARTEYYTFPATMSFSVLSGQAISDVRTVSQ